jgi:DNA-binding NarL/FixJ family response regulator
MTQDFALSTSTTRAIGRTSVSVYAPDPLTAAGIGALLTGRPEVTLLPHDRQADTDVIVISADTVTTEFIDMLRKIAERASARLVLILTDRWAIDIFAAVGLGLAAVIPRPEVSAERLIGTVKTVMQGNAELPADMQGLLLAQIRRLQRDVLAPRGLNAHGIDDREVDVLRLLAAGFGLRDIGAKLSLSERTVKNILHALNVRLGMHNRTQVVAHAVRAGII